MTIAKWIQVQLLTIPNFSFMMLTTCSQESDPLFAWPSSQESKSSYWLPPLLALWKWLLAVRSRTHYSHDHRHKNPSPVTDHSSPFYSYRMPIISVRIRTNYSNDHHHKNPSPVTDHFLNLSLVLYDWPIILMNRDYPKNIQSVTSYISTMM